MSEVKPSPGPWHVYEGGNFVTVGMEGYNQYVAHKGYLAGPYCIAHVEHHQSHDHTPTHEQAMANGKLLAAAPTMQEALRRVLRDPFEPDKWRRDVENALKSAGGTE